MGNANATHVLVQWDEKSSEHQGRHWVTVSRFTQQDIVVLRFKVGDAVVVSQDLRSSDTTPFCLPMGLLGRVDMVDADGDYYINFDLTTNRFMSSRSEGCGGMGFSLQDSS